MLQLQDFLCPKKFRNQEKFWKCSCLWSVSLVTTTQVLPKVHVSNPNDCDKKLYPFFYFWKHTVIKGSVFVPTQFPTSVPVWKHNDLVHCSDSSSPTSDACRGQTQWWFYIHGLQTFHVLKYQESTHDWVLGRTINVHITTPTSWKPSVVFSWVLRLSMYFAWRTDQNQILCISGSCGSKKIWFSDISYKLNMQHPCVTTLNDLLNRKFHRSSWPMGFHSLAPGRSGYNFKSIIFKLISKMSQAFSVKLPSGEHHKTSLMSTLVQVMA